MNEKLATIEVITEIKPIEGADFIEAAKIQGYWSVIKKGEYKVGGLIIFVQPDTLLLRESWNKFIWPKNDQDPNGPPIRIKVAKFKKQISQGLVLPADLMGNNLDKCVVGDEVSDCLEIKKYEKPISPELIGKIKGNFPGFLRKTDECNALSYPGVIDELKGKHYFITTKRDGQSLTFYYREGVFGCCTRNLEKMYDANDSHWKIAAELDLENKLKGFGFNAAVAGEFVGPGINGNKIKLARFNFAVFNIWNIDEQRYLDYMEMYSLCDAYDILTVKIIEKGENFSYDSNQLIQMANNQLYETGEIAEGIVVRSKTEQYSPTLDGRLSFKIISEKFALKHGE